MTKLFDHYSLRARLQPALLTLAPLALGVLAWLGFGNKGLSALWTLLGTVGATYALAIHVRNKGKQLEPKLWESWGGTPTNQLLRHQGAGNPVLRARWHEQLGMLVGNSFPSESEESANPQQADQFYSAAVRLLINETRDIKAYPLVYTENVNYGFCRNLYGMKCEGIICSILGVILSIAAAISKFSATTPNALAWVCALINFCFLFFWIFSVKSAWVKVPAFAYAERLLESAQRVTQSSRRKK